MLVEPPVDSESVNASNESRLLGVRPGLYILVLTLFLVGTYAYKLRSEGIFACPVNGYESKGYVAYCNATAYGDYDHGAFWFGLEPEARRFAAAADVMFLGNSKLQFGFSSLATDDWFSSAAASYYLLGFSHTENSAFVGPLLEKLKPRAKMYVINADQFFDDRETEPVAEILHGNDAEARYRRKKLWQTVHRPLCANLPQICGTGPTFSRRHETGEWILGGSGPLVRTEVADSLMQGDDRWEGYAKLGEAFISSLPVERECVLLTIVPSEATRRTEALALAKLMQLELISPQIDGLHTFDGLHLDRPSAEIWSEAFFRSAASRISRCLGEEPNG